MARSELREVVRNARRFQCALRMDSRLKSAGGSVRLTCRWRCAGYSCFVRRPKPKQEGSACRVRIEP